MSLPWELEMGSKVVALEAHEGGDRRQIGNGCDGDGEGLSSEKSMHQDGSGANTGAVDIASEELVTRDYIRVMKNIQSWQGRKVSSTRTELRSLSSMSSVTHKSKMGYGSHQEVGGKGNEESLPFFLLDWMSQVKNRLRTGAGSLVFLGGRLLYSQVDGAGHTEGIGDSSSWNSCRTLR
ncbi:hypothetical protein ACOSQ2_026694 [Xanthoceras sorbifolium]